MRFAAVAFGLLLACGCESAPAAPTPQPFPLAAGSYVLAINGVGGPCVTTGGVHSSAEVSILLTADGDGWAVSVPGDSLSGRFTSDGFLLSGTLQGSASGGTVIFQTSIDGTGELTLSGGARDGDTFDGMVTSGTPYFRGTGADSGNFATCVTFAFELRAAP